MLSADHPPHSSICLLYSVRPFLQMYLVTTYLMNDLSNLDKTYSEYLTAPTALLMTLIKLWRSKVKVTAGCRDGAGIHVDTSQSRPSNSSCDHELWNMTLNSELNLQSVRMNRHTKYLGQKLFSSQVIVSVHTYNGPRKLDINAD